MSTPHDRWNRAQRRLLEDFQEVLEDIVKQDIVPREDFFLAVNGAMKFVYTNQDELAERAMTKRHNISRWMNEEACPTKLARQLIIVEIIKDVKTIIEYPL